MSRFQLLEAHFIGSVRYKAGTIIADAAPQAGDKLVSTLTVNSVTPSMMALDAAAIALKNASRYANAVV
jgi:hypothetical protein